MWLFLSVTWVCLQFVIVILTYYFWVSFMRTGMALAIYTFAWSSLSLRHSSKISCGDSNGNWTQFCASSEGSGESAHLHRLTLAFVTVQNLFCCLKWRFVCYSRQQRILWWVCTFPQAVTGQCNKYQDILCCQKRLCTFAQARLSLLFFFFFFFFLLLLFVINIVQNTNIHKFIYNTKWTYKYGDRSNS